MIVFLLGISITLNIISAIIFLFIYKYSLKGFKNKIEKELVRNFSKDDNFSVLEVFNDNKSVSSFNK